MSARAYTSLQVVERGVVLFAQHLERISRAGPECVAAYLAFAKSAAPGAYALRAEGGALTITPRAPSALADGMPSRFMVSPYAGRPRSFDKPAPPSAYDAVRIRGVATLLTSPDGAELYESCVASLLAWDGEKLLAVPEDRPAVRSAALGALRSAGLITEGPILARSTQPLALVNAVAGIALPDVPGRAPFPKDVRLEIARVFDQSASRG